MRKLSPVVALLTFCTLLLCAPSYAAERLLQLIPPPVNSPLPAPQINATSWLLTDFESGWIIDSGNANARIEPASLAKLMTAYLVFDALSKQKMKLDTQVSVSKKAWQTGGSQMFLEVDTKVSIAQLLKGLIIQSGNDAAVALAEYVGGSENKFVLRMNQMAAQLGMLNTHFVNSSGLPHARQYSTALDMTILTRELIQNFPDYYRIYSEKEYTYNGITQKSRNILLWSDATVDGIKTGYTKKSGYCLIGTAKRGNMRLIATVIGAQSEKQRAEQVQSLLHYGFTAYEGLVAYRPAEEIHSVRLWMGQQAKAQVGVMHTISILYPKGTKHKLVGELDLADNLVAPLRANQQVGTIAVKFDGETIHTASLHVHQDYPQGEWTSRLVDYFKRLFFRLGIGVG